MNKVFEDALVTRLDNIYQKSKTAHDLEKRRMMLRLKQFYFRQRVLTYADEKLQQDLKLINSQKFKQIHLTEKWDQSYKETQHPDIAHTPLYYLSKVIGRVDLTIPELTKSYLTNPENRR